LATLKARAWERVKAIRELREEGVFGPSGRLLVKATCSTTKGVAQCDDASRNFITGLVVKAGLQGAAFSVNFTMADNTQLLMDASAIADFGVQVAAFVEATHKHSLVFRAAIFSATTADDLSAIDLDAGWPS
jgi:hypothetical protein